MDAGCEGNRPNAVLEDAKKQMDVKVKTEFSASDILACSICGEICKRAVVTPCCEASACRACAIKKITSTRSCWLGSCSREGVATNDLDNDEVMRRAVEQYKNDGSVDQDLLEELRGRMVQETQDISKIMKNGVAVKEEGQIKEEKDVKSKIGECLVEHKEQNQKRKNPRKGKQQRYNIKRIKKDTIETAEKEKDDIVKAGSSGKIIKHILDNPNYPEKKPKFYACLKSDCTGVFDTWGDTRRHMQTDHHQWELAKNKKGKVKKSRRKAKKLQNKGATVNEMNTNSSDDDSSEDD